MPQYKVDLEGGGDMTVNASSPEAAADNVRASGNTPKGSTNSGGGGGGGGGTSSSSGGGGGGGQTGPVTALGGGMYQTVNGPKSVAQMSNELRQAGWPGATSYSQEGVNQEVIAAYARTAQGPGTSSSTPGGPDVPIPGVDMANLTQYNSDLDMANKAAYQAYLNAKLALDSDELAFKKAQQAFSETISRANLLGTFEGQTTLPAQQQYWSQAFQQEQENNKQVQNYLTLLSQLRGPQDYGQYLKVMASTPQGLRGLVNAAAGQQGAAFGVTGVPTQGVTLGGFMGAAGGGGPAAPGGAPTTGTSYDEYMKATQDLPPPSQISPQAFNAMTESQKKLLLGMYEQAGWNVTDALQQYQASLPKFGSTTPQTGQVKLV